MKAILGAVSVALVAAMLVAPADAGRRKHKFHVWMPDYGQSQSQGNFSRRNRAKLQDDFQLADSYGGNSGGGNYPISEADAADIAQSQYPGAKVLKVNLLPSGVYAVTLKQGGNVSRVRVNARTGAVQ